MQCLDHHLNRLDQPRITGDVVDHQVHHLQCQHLTPAVPAFGGNRSRSLQGDGGKWLSLAGTHGMCKPPRGEAPDHRIDLFYFLQGLEGRRHGLRERRFIGWRLRVSRITNIGYLWFGHRHQITCQQPPQVLRCPQTVRRAAREPAAGSPFVVAVCRTSAWDSVAEAASWALTTG